MNAYNEKPVPKIQWKKNEIEANNVVDNYTITTFTSRLVFNLPTRNDSGNYNCLVLANSTFNLTKKFDFLFQCELFFKNK